MPERPKRRKNNKNKRKHKINRPDTCKNDDVNNLNNGDACNSQNNKESDRVSANETSLELSKDNEDISSIRSSEILIGDLNNNSNQNINSVLPGSSVDNISIVDDIDSIAYFVEPPDNSMNTSKSNLKNIKSKSLDNEDTTNIVEITEDKVDIEDNNALSIVDSQNALITHVDSDVEWEVADDLGNLPQTHETATGTLSVTTLPLTIVQSNQNESLTPEEEVSLRNYLKTINLVTQPENVNAIEINTQIEEIINQEIRHRLRKRASTDEFSHRLGPPRMLDVIDEEGSSESSMTSRRQSYLSDKKSDIEDLEDDVFEEKDKINKQKFVPPYRSIHKKGFGQLVPQECILVGAKMRDPDVEARGEWTMKTVEKMSGAEVVYLTDTSSSSSSLHEPGDDGDDDGVDTDVSIRMITPTIEVTDTENFFKKNFIRTSSDSKSNKFSKYSQTSLTERSNKLNDYNELSTKEEEHIIKIEHQDDLNQEIKGKDERTFVVDGKKGSQNSNDIVHSESIKHAVEKMSEGELIENDEPVNHEIHKEHIINIETEKDIMTPKSESNNACNEKNHEIVVLSTDDIATNLYVKDIDETKTEAQHISNYKQINELPTKDPQINDKRKNTEHFTKNYKTQENNKNVEETELKMLQMLKSNVWTDDINKVEIDQQNPLIQNNQNISLDTSSIAENTEIKDSKYVLETKIIKCEFNDAINNLINEVSHDSEGHNEYPKDTFNRQDSSSSVGSSSQCTAKYNPNCESLNDISNIVHEINVNNESKLQQTSLNMSHIKDVFECIAETTEKPMSNIDVNLNPDQPLRLKDLCVHKIADLPYGDKILEELASVSKRLQDFTSIDASHKTIVNRQHVQSVPVYSVPNVSIRDDKTKPMKLKDAIPPPIQPRCSSLKKSQEEEHGTRVSTKRESSHICLSPSQKMLMDQTSSIITKENSSHLVDKHTRVTNHRESERCYKTQYYNKNENDTNHSPTRHLKSETGSRLLALIRDPNLTRNINSLNDRLANSQVKRAPIIFPEYSNEVHKSRNLSFKPIPPPRPRKFSTSFYESDESSDFTDNSLRSLKRDRKLFHYSTGNLNKEIENDVCSIQNMHRFLTDTREELNNDKCPRRPSLPKDLCEQQMEYIRKKEKEVEAEIQRLESLHKDPSRQWKGPRAPLISEKQVTDERITAANNCSISRKKDILERTQGHDVKKGKISSLFSSSQEELLREKMYTEYVTQMAEREERKHHKVIKITNSLDSANKISKSMSSLDAFDTKINNRIEKEFISKARERWNKLGIKDPETEDERDCVKKIYKEPKVIEHKIKVIDGGEEKDVKKLPSHLQEFVRFTARDREQSAGPSETVMIAPTFKARSTSPAIWRPGAPPPECGSARSPGAPPPPPPPPIWSPSSAGASPQTPRKTFRPVHFEESPPTRRKFGNSEQNGCTSGSESESRLRTSQSAPVSGLSTLGGTTTTSRLPRAQNPTVTLLQKAREGQLSRGANYIQQERDAARLPRDRPSPPRSDPVHALRKEYASESEADRRDYERGGPRKMADAHRKVEGIGPITKDGMPVALRSEVKDPSRWYKKMYDTIHKNKYDDDYVTIRYKSRRDQPLERPPSNKSQYAYFDPRSGYLSEPEGGLSRLGTNTWSDAYDSDIATGPRRRTASVQEERRFSEASSCYMPSNNKYSTLASARASQEVYKNQPGKIENYVPGKSSVIDKESKQWWDEVMDIFDGQNISSTTSLPQASPKEKKDLTATILSKSNMARALKESGYESDSTLVFRRREDTDGPLSPAERRAAYRDLQAGGEPPLRGFRSPAPPRQESPRRYVESDVNIHYRCPVRHDPLPLVPERELARQQAEHMKRLYREQKRNKYLQELQDMQSRRHQDNFIPSQKNILPLNRYDEAEKVIAKALYTFNGQTSRELSFKKGEMIHVRRQIDNNWYEGELHGRIGLFPYNYVEIQKGDVIQTPKKPAVIEGRARAKFDFTAQTNLELPLKKGEVVVLTRRIDQNWWEGRNGGKTGIFPDSYVTVLQEPNPGKPEPQPSLNSDKPIASPAAHGLLNGTAKRSMGAHSYMPQQNSQALSNAPPATQPLPAGYVARPAQATLSASERGYGPPSGAGVDLNNTEPLYVDTNAEAVPYRAMYKYRPQNPDELELNEGDTVYVLEKCDDGWYVGSSQRTGRFGTFPGNYVERI